MKQDILKKLQITELEILLAIDEFCKKNDIDYSLYGGTLIGAVRHQGFIPWDDDIDIVMTRMEYTKFCCAWNEHPVNGYYLENFETDNFTQNTHAKIRKDKTIFLSSIEDENIGHHGIWIDIFILDKISLKSEIGDNIIAIGRKMILMAKANGKFPGEKLTKRLFRSVLKLWYPANKRKKLLKLNADILRKNAQDITNNFELCDMCTLEYLNIRFPQETGERYTTLYFENHEFPVFSNYDTVLKIMYGNYMELPPV